MAHSLSPSNALVTLKTKHYDSKYYTKSNIKCAVIKSKPGSPNQCIVNRG